MPVESIINEMLDSMKEYFSRSTQWLILIALPFAFIAAILRSLGVATIYATAGILLLVLIGLGLGFLLGRIGAIEVENIQMLILKTVSFVFFIAILGGLVSFFAEGGLPAAMGEYIQSEILKIAFMALASSIIKILASIPVWLYALAIHIGAYISLKYSF